MNYPLPTKLLTELTMSQYGWPESLAFTYLTARDLVDRGVTGCYVECGVANGVHPAAIAMALDDAGSDAKVHLFDSFQGLPHAGPRDRDFIVAGYGDGTGLLEPIGVSACSLPGVKANLLRWLNPQAMSRFVYYEGWFQDTVARAARHIGPVAFLRLDGDLYESTLVCLEELEPLVVSGGIVVLDDWNLDGCRAAFSEYFTGEHQPIPEPVSITASGDVWWRKP